MNPAKIPELLILLMCVSGFFLFVVIGASMSGMMEKETMRAGWRTVDNDYVEKKLRDIQSQYSDIVALKVLRWDSEHKVWRSPKWGHPWNDGQIMADKEPDPRHDHGIYTGELYSQVESYLLEDDSNYLFAVGLYEPVDKYDVGYRSAGAYIIKRLS